MSVKSLIKKIIGHEDNLVPYDDEKRLLNLQNFQLYPNSIGMDYSFLKNQKTPLLTKETPIASIGSCFAREIKDYLEANSFNYIQTAEGPNARHGSAAWDRVYNTFCLKQEFERAFTEFKPEERFWELTNGKLRDPYRKGVEWSSTNEAEEALEKHRESAREALLRAEVLIITVGLTEIWYSKLDNSVFYQVPPFEVFNNEKHAFRSATYQENLDNLLRIKGLIKENNPNCKLIVTVSPVPLRATFQNQNVVISNTNSKATLVAATNTFCSMFEDVYYFPSYEIVTTANKNSFQDDLRHVTRDTVKKIMDVFEYTFIE